MDQQQQQQQTMPSSRERIETSMGLLMAHMQRDKASSQLIDALGGQACFTNPSRSGLSETDYIKLPLGQIVREENRTTLPPELVQHFQRMRCQFQTGVFAEIQRAWAAVDSDLVIWNYRTGKGVVYYDGIENVILAVDLVRPKPNIFRSHVHYLLAVATPSEVAILGVTLAENSANNDIELHFVNEPLYSYPLENIVVTKIKGARNGRIFLGGQDGSLYEFSYFAQRGWLQSLCKLTNCSSRFPLLNNLLPALFRGSDPVTEICIDNARQILYTLSDKGIISVYDLGQDGQEMIYVASAGEDTLLKTVTDCVPTQIRRVIHLESLPADEAGAVHLVAFTQSGARIFLTTCEPATKTGRPCLLLTLHVRLPLALPHKITKISNGLNIESASLMIDQQNENRHFLIAVDHFAHFRRANQFVETYSFMVVDRNIWSISPADTPGRRKRQGSHNSLSRFVMVSLAGCQIISMMTPTEQLRHLLSESRGALHDDPIKTFFAYYNYLEGCVMCLQLICDGDIVPQVSRWASEAFNYYGGEPQLDVALTMPSSSGFRQPFPNTHPQETMMNSMNIPFQHQQQQQPYAGAGGQFSAPHTMSTPFRPPPYMNTQFIPVSPIGPTAATYMQHPGIHPYTGDMSRQNQQMPSQMPQQQQQQQQQQALTHQPGQLQGQIIDNNNPPGSMTGLTTNFQSLNQSFAHSFKHDSIFVYFSRILRPIFESQLAKEAPPHAGERARLSLVLTSAALTPVLQQLHGFKTFLHDFCNAPGGSNMYIRSQVLPATDAMQWKRKAILEEQNSVNNLLVLVTHTMEVLNLWRVTAEHDIEAISLNMKPELFNYLKAITVREFILCDKQLLSALATSIVDSYLRDGATTAVVSNKLKEFCPSIYGNEDALYTEAYEMLTKASEITNEREKEEMLKQALQLCRKVSVQALHLSMVCRILDSSRYYEGLLNICLWAAHNVDPHNFAYDHYEHGEPQDDDRGRKAYIARRECYQLVTAMLDGLYRKVRPQDQLDPGENNVANQQKYDEMLTRCIESQDPLLHMCVFDWLLATDQREKLINLRSKGLEKYLRHRTEREPTSITTLELLARHHEVHKKLESAVHMWLNLANWQGELPLEIRTTYLARASLCAQSGGTNELQQQVDETLEVARIQEEIARHLPNNEREAISMRLYPINELYTQFAEKYDLPECQLRLLMCVEHADVNLINFLWTKLIEQASRKNDLPGVLRKACLVFKDGRNFFPVELIVAHCERIALNTQVDPLWLANILAECGKDWPSIERIYYDLYQRPQMRESDEDLTPYAKLLKQLKSNHEWQKQISLGKRIGLYRIHEELGSGNFAQVKAATHCLTKGKVAIKIIDKGKLDQKTHRMLTREISTMEALHHPNAIRLYEVVETLSKVYLVMEFAEGGELFKRISSKGAYPERDAKIIFTQICSAVDHMHKQNIVHRDLKAENVFLAGNLYVKVGDYGFSTTISFKEQLTTFCGSPPYAAPELFREEKYPGPYVDIWALGVMLYFIVSALMPFTAPTVSALRKLILEGQYEVPSCVSSECQDLIQGILQMVPQDRLTLAQIQSHRFLYGVIIPTPLDKYNICPRIEDQPPDQSSLQDHDLEMRATGSASAITIPQSKEEIKVRKQLNEFGITDKMMAECQYSGAKSMVTGTYRILLHRLQLAAHSDELYGAVPGQLRHPSRFHVLSGRNKPRQDLLGPSSYSGDNFTYTQNRIRRSGPLSSAEPEIQLERQSGLTISKACAVL